MSTSISASSTASTSTRTPLRVLLVGSTGTLGQHLAAGFQLPQYAERVRLSLLVRQTTAETDGPKKQLLAGFQAKGAQLVIGDLSQSEAELTALLQQSGVDVVVSAVTMQQLGEQTKLLAAGKAAGATWFVPSEFGVDVEALDLTVTPALLRGMFEQKK